MGYIRRKLLTRGGRGGIGGVPGDETAPCGACRAGISRLRGPVRRQPQGGIHHPGQHGRRRAPCDGRAGLEGAALVGADADPGAVERQNIRAIRGILRHVGDVPAGGVGRGNERVVDRGKRGLRQRPGQHMGRLGAGGGEEIQPVQLAGEHALALKIGEIRRIRRLPLRREGGGAGLRIAGGVQAADAGGEDHDLPHRHRFPQAEGPVPLADGQAVFIQRGGVLIKDGAGGHVRKFAGIGLEPDKVFRGVFRGGSGNAQRRAQNGGQRQRRGPFFQSLHGSSFRMRQDGMRRSSAVRSST